MPTASLPVVEVASPPSKMFAGEPSKLFATNLTSWFAKFKYSTSALPFHRLI